MTEFKTNLEKHSERGPMPRRCYAVGYERGMHECQKGLYENPYTAGTAQHDGYMDGYTNQYRREYTYPEVLQ